MLSTHFWRSDIINSDEGFCVRVKQYFVQYKEGLLRASIDSERLPGQITLYGLPDSDRLDDGTKVPLSLASRLKIAHRMVDALEFTGLTVQVRPSLPLENER